MVACFLWLGLKAAATFSSEAHTAVLVIQVTQVSYREKVPAAFVSSLFLLRKLGGVCAMSMIVMSTWASIGLHCCCEISKQEEGEGGWDWD